MAFLKILNNERYDKTIEKLQADTAAWGAIPPTNDTEEIKQRVALIEKMRGYCAFMSRK